MRISVIVPTFNRAHQIRHTLETVLGQTEPPSEVIVVDDGSTDATEAVCEAFGSRIRYLRQENSGVSAARNHGASMAHGEAFAFVDSDDVWDPRKLAFQRAALSTAPEAGWSITGLDVIGLDGRVIDAGNGFSRVFGVFATAGLDPLSFFEKYFDSESVVAGDSSFRIYHGDAYRRCFWAILRCRRPPLCVVSSSFSRADSIPRCAWLRKPSSSTDLLPFPQWSWYRSPW